MKHSRTDQVDSQAEDDALPEIPGPPMRLFGIQFQAKKSSDPLDSITWMFQGIYDSRYFRLGEQQNGLLACWTGGTAYRSNTFGAALLLALLDLGLQPPIWPVGNPLGVAGYWVTHGLAYHPGCYTDDLPCVEVEGPPDGWPDQVAGALRQRRDFLLASLSLNERDLIEDIAKRRILLGRLNGLNALWQPGDTPNG